MSETEPETGSRQDGGSAEVEDNFTHGQPSLHKASNEEKGKAGSTSKPKGRAGSTSSPQTKTGQTTSTQSKAGLTSMQYSDFEAGHTGESDQRSVMEESEVDDDLADPNEDRLDDHEVPPVDLLSAPDRPDRTSMDRQLDELGEVLVEKLRTFNVESELRGRTTGPMVTQFEVVPAPGVKVNRIANLDADLALAMKAKTVRIVAPIPGKGAVGVEIPNPQPEIVNLREILETAPRTAFTDFYRDWYRPNLMALIMVGDFEADAMETLAREAFSSLENPDGAPERPVYPVPDHKETPLITRQWRSYCRAILILSSYPDILKMLRYGSPYHVLLFPICIFEFHILWADFDRFMHKSGDLLGYRHRIFIFVPYFCFFFSYSGVCKHD